ncbi:DUF3347 domain-containing protein, partial [bacterium]|nr:DUF3347 domain-containing protein [bacterium]
WLVLDAYESDLEWIRYGQTVEFAVDACPGEAFTGRVAFIAPILDEMTRTVDVRVNVPNKDGRLKPGFLANAHITSSIAADGRAMDASLAGKWICPMHPEIVKDGPAPCDICGMKIVTAESLGYAAPAAAAAEMPLVIPASAPLITGKRAVVYVAVPGGRGRFEGRDVVLGPRAGDYYTVHSGLREGEHVVVNGAFKIDSTMQIQAKPSMMSLPGAAVTAEPPREVKIRADVPERLKEQLAAVVQASFGVQAALAGDDLASARAAASAVATVLDSADMKLPGGDAHGAWMTEHAALKRAGEGIARAGDIGAARVAFKEMSDALVAAANRFGLAGTTAVFKADCPMAFDGKGGDWLQAGPAVRNPYFGAQMLECGDIMPFYRP